MCGCSITCCLLSTSQNSNCSFKQTPDWGKHNGAELRKQKHRSYLAPFPHFSHQTLGFEISATGGKALSAEGHRRRHLLLLEVCQKLDLVSVGNQSKTYLSRDCQWSWMREYFNFCAFCIFLIRVRGPDANPVCDIYKCLNKLTSATYLHLHFVMTNWKALWARLCDQS